MLPFWEDVFITNWRMSFGCSRIMVQSSAEMYICVITVISLIHALSSGQSSIRDWHFWCTTSSICTKCCHSDQHKAHVTSVKMVVLGWVEQCVIVFVGSHWVVQPVATRAGMVVYFALCWAIESKATSMKFEELLCCRVSWQGVGGEWCCIINMPSIVFMCHVSRQWHKKLFLR